MKRNHPTVLPSSTFCQRPAAVGCWACAAPGLSAPSDNASASSESSRKLENSIMITLLTRDWNDRRLRRFRKRFQRQKHGAPPSCPPSSVDTKLLLQAGGRRRVLEHQPLIGIDVAVGFLRHQRAFVETAQDQLDLAGISVDVADREDAGHVGL